MPFFHRKMAATDGQIILAASRFGDIIPVYLRDFSKQQLPAVAKITKGQHQNLGVPTLSAPSLQSTALFLSAGKNYQILAQPIKIKEGRRPTNIGCKVLIPESYLGFFELLSEDGRSTRCIDSVLELSKRRNLRVLLREPFRCTQMNRTIQAGEILTTINDNGKYLQCKNVQDEIITLPLEAKAKFSPIAKEDSISGVHSVRNLLLKRMPVIVRLVHGSAPKGLKQPFVPELRLLGCVESDRIFALPLQKDTDLISVPLNAKIKLQRAKNMDKLENFIEYSRFLEKAQRLLSDEKDRIQMIDMKLSEKEKKASKFHSRNKMLPTTGMISGGVENGYILRKSVNTDFYSKRSQQIQQSSQIANEYNEIDHIYDYVRGLTPLSKGLTRFEPTCESPTEKSQATTESSGNYCSLLRLSHTSNCHKNYNNNTNNNIKSANTSNINNNASSLESSKQTVNNYSNINHPNCSQGIYSSPIHQQYRHKSHHQLQQTYYQNQSQTPTHNANLPPSAPESIEGANGKLFTPTVSVMHHYNHDHIQTNIKPVPPPIETIPGKKLPEKRQRPTLKKNYVKNDVLNLNDNGSTTGNNNHNQKPQQLYHNKNTKLVNQTHQTLNSNNGTPALCTAIPLIAADCDPEPQSPLFHIRYKSLSNLQLALDVNNTAAPIAKTVVQGHSDIKAKCNNTNRNKEAISNFENDGSNQYQQEHLSMSKTAITTGAREGTLESSRSGGRTSGDSKLPEKKTRRLSRPRSLSNLVWDLKPSKDKAKKKLYIHHFDHRQQSTLYL